MLRDIERLRTATSGTKPHSYWVLKGKQGEHEGKRHELPLYKQQKVNAEQQKLFPCPRLKKKPDVAAAKKEGPPREKSVGSKKRRYWQD